MKTVLIVDDSSQNLYFLELLLQRYDFRSIPAPNGVVALAEARKQPPDLVISDILMPEMDGWTLCREWRADPKLKEIPFIFYTATYTDPKDEEFALRLGADRFVTKPQEPEALLNILSEVLRHPASAEQRESHPGDEFYPEYSEILFRKLQKKLASLERANSELTLANNKLAQANEELLLLSTAVDATPAAIVITDAQAKIEWVNEAFTRTSGYLFAEVIGQNPRILKSGRHSPEFYAELWQTIAGGESWHGEFINRRKNGEIYIEDATVAPVRNTAGIISHYVSIRVDITEKKRLNEQLLRVQRLESIGMLASGIAHDLNNVLSPVLMAAPLLRRHVTDSRARELIDTMERSAARGGGLIRQILTFARGVVGEPQLVEPRHLLSEMAALITHTFPQEISFGLDCAPDLWPIHACPSQIHQVLLNLCVNARDALMPKGGSLRMRAANICLSDGKEVLAEGLRAGNWLMISVEDSGTGMPPEVLSRVWEPFFTTKAPDKGTGLGLYTVRSIIESHHGFIKVESHAGQGTAFRVFLPAENPIHPTRSEKERRTPTGHGEFILLADERSDYRKSVGELLTQQGYRVLTAPDGGHAMSLIISHSADLALLITNIETPALSGSALARTVRQLNPATKLLLLSSREACDEAEANIKPDGRLVSPFSEEALLESVRDILPSSDSYAKDAGS